MALKITVFAWMVAVANGENAPSTFVVEAGQGYLERVWPHALHAWKNGSVHVHLKGGLHVLQKPLEMTAPGTHGGHFHLTADPADAGAPIITAAVPVTGWTAVPSSPGVFMAPIPANISITSVFLLRDRLDWRSGERMNESFLGNSSQYGFKLLTAADTNITDSGYVTRSAPLLAALQRHDATCMLGRTLGACASSIQALYRMVGDQWTESRCEVKTWSYNTDPTSGAIISATLTMSSPGWSLIRDVMYPNDYPSTFIGLRSSLEGRNGYSDGAQPGTGYISAAEGLVFYRPRPQDGTMDPSVVVVAARDVGGPLIRLSGQRNLDSTQPPQPVQGVSFTGITFAYAGWNPCSDLADPEGTLCGAYSPDQSGFGYSCTDIAKQGALKAHATHAVPGAVEVHTGRDILFDSCVWVGSGANALVIDEGSQDVTVSSSTFVDNGCSAIRLAQVDDWNTTDPQKQNARVTVYNNSILGSGMVTRDCAAVMSGYLLNSTIEHNTIRNGTWGGICVGWGWGDPARPTLGGNRILSNDVQWVNIGTADGGPIYVLGGQYYQSENAYNFVGHARHHAALVYHDEGSSRWYTHDNVVDQEPADCVPNGGWTYVFLSAWAPSEHDLLIERIYSRWLNTTHIGPGANITCSDITVIGIDDPWPAPAQTIIAQAGVLQGS